MSVVSHLPCPCSGNAAAQIGSSINPRADSSQSISNSLEIKRRSVCVKGVHH